VDFSYDNDVILRRKVLLSGESPRSAVHAAWCSG